MTQRRSQEISVVGPDIIFGYELTFKHLDVQKGYFEVFIDGKLYDTKVFVK